MYPMKDADVASCSVSVAPQEQNSKGFKNAFEREHFSFLFFFFLLKVNHFPNPFAEKTSSWKTARSC